MTGVGPRVAIGETIAGYRIDGVAGLGGMGVVYRATQVRLERPVAFKVITPGFAGHSEYRERFQREARLAASIEHPNVLPVYEADELDSGELYLAMRWVDGIDLRELLAIEQSLAPARAARLLAPVARALHAAHACGLVHRDVKPANILIAEGDEHVYLADFGIAIGAGEDPGLTRTGAFVGSVAYAAPERIDGRRGGPPADVYALGCVLFEALTGHAPFNRSNEVATMNAHLQDPIPSVRAEVPSVPGALDAVVARALAKAPADRFGSAGEMAAAIEAAVTQTAAETAALRAPPVRSRHRGPLRAGGAVVVTGIAVTVAVILGNGGGGRAGGGGPPPAGTGASASTAAPQASAIHVTPKPELSIHPGAVALAGADIAVADPAGGRIQLVHGDGRPTTSLAVGRRPSVLAVDARGRVWVADAGSVRVIDPRGPRTLARIAVGRAPVALAIGGGRAWVADGRDDDVRAIDLSTLRVVGAPIPTGGRGAVAIADGSTGTLWVANRASSDVTAIRDGRAARPEFVPGGPVSLAAGANGDVWVGTAKGTVVHIAASGRVLGGPLRLRAGPVALALAGAWVFAVSRDDASLALIPASGPPGVRSRVSLAPAQSPAAIACTPHKCVVSDAPTRRLVAASF